MVSAFLVPVLSATAYVEVIPTRQPFAGSQLPAASQWTRYPAAGAWQVVSAAGGAAVSTSVGGVLFAHADAKETWWNVRLTGAANVSAFGGDLRLVGRADAIIALVTSGTIHRVSCLLSGSGSTCKIHTTVTAALGSVRATAATASAVWLASQNGLFLHRDGTRVATKLLVDGVAAVAASGRGLVAAGNSERLWLLDEESGAVVRWEWVSDVPSGQGGVIGDAVRGLAWGDVLLQSAGDTVHGEGGGHYGAGGLTHDHSSEPSLFVGTQSCINVRDARGAFVRVDADDGLPVSNVTSIAAARGPSGAPQLWVGTALGVALWQSIEPRWRYFYGPRWLVGSSVRSIAAVGESAVVVSDGGVTWLSQVNFSLAHKAAVMDSALPRHNRHGLVAECEMASFGDVDASCFNHDSDNNGLWTSLVVGAEYMRHAVTREPAALAAASRHLRGLVLLHEVTGGFGFPARSACAPSELKDDPPRCGGGIHDKTRWVNSTAPQARAGTHASVPSVNCTAPARHTCCMAHRSVRAGRAVLIAGLVAAASLTTARDDV